MRTVRRRPKRPLKSSGCLGWERTGRCHNSVGWVGEWAFHAHFTEEEIKAQQGDETCIKMGQVFWLEVHCPSY